MDIQPGKEENEDGDGFISWFHHTFSVGLFEMQHTMPTLRYGVHFERMFIGMHLSLANF